MGSTADRVLERLQASGFRKEAGEWRGNSPLRPGSNSEGFTVKFDDDEHGTWYDHVTEESGSLYELAERLGIETPKREPVADSKRGYSGLEDYALAHGVPAKTFTDAQWKEVTYQGRLALCFPTASGKRWRFLDGERPSFKSDKGYKRCWFGLARAVELANELDMPLIIVNGEPSVVVCHHFGVPACGVTSGEKKDIPAALLDELKAKYSGEIVVALDCDKKGAEAALGMAAQLNGAGFKARAVDLMLGDRGDAADFCKLHTTGAAAKLPNMPELTAVPRPVLRDAPKVDTLIALKGELAAARNASDSERYIKTLLSLGDQVDELVKAQVAPPVTCQSVIAEIRGEAEDWRSGKQLKRGYLSKIAELDGLIGGFRPGVYTIIGDTGHGKSWLAASIAAGLAWYGAGAIVPTESMPSVFFRRMAALLSGVNERDFGRCTATEWDMVERALSWLADYEQKIDVYPGNNPNPRALEKWTEKQLANGMGYKWMVIDSLSNMGSTFNESIFERTSAAADAAQLVARMGMVVVCTVQVGRKLDGRSDLVPSTHDAKGSGRVEENSDVLLALYNHGKLLKMGITTDETHRHYRAGHLMLRCLKHRHNDAAEGQDVFVRYLPGIGIRSCLPEVGQKAVA